MNGQQFPIAVKQEQKKKPREKEWSILNLVNGSMRV